MRLWTLHPRYLDAKGLVAVWREALLAQQVLRGRTRGYRRHPQLKRFRRHARPLAMIATYLRAIHAESAARGYRFDASRIGPGRLRGRVAETEGQLRFEWRRLLGKIAARSPALHRRLRPLKHPDPHPLFAIVPGAQRTCEKATVGQEAPGSQAPAKRGKGPRDAKMKGR